MIHYFGDDCCRIVMNCFIPWRFGAARLRTSEVFVHYTGKCRSRLARFVPERDTVPRSKAADLQRGTFVGRIPRTVHSRRTLRPKLLPCAANSGEPPRLWSKLRRPQDPRDARAIPLPMR